MHSRTVCGLETVDGLCAELSYRSKASIVDVAVSLGQELIEKVRWAVSKQSMVLSNGPHGKSSDF